MPSPKIPKPHQDAGAGFIAERQRCALWWVPRRGKTLATVLGLERIKAKRVLVVCPVSVMPVWSTEFAERGWPEASLCRGTSGQKHAAAQAPGPVICSFESAWRLNLASQEWDAIVFDESIRLSNWEAKSVKHWFGVKCLAVILLSGAPCPEGELQIAAQMLICRGVWFGHRDIYCYLREYWHYNSERYRWECDDHGHLAEVRRRMNIVGQTGTLADIGVQDKKLFSFMPVEPSAGMIKAFALLERDQTMLPAVKGLKIQMAANGLAGEGKSIHVVDDTKIDALITYIKDRQADEPGYKCVVFSRFVEQIERLATKLECAMIHGGVTGIARQRQVEDFQQGRKAVIVSQVRPGKMGLDFSMAGEIHYLSNSWSGDDRIQSMERCTNLNKAEAVSIVDWASHDVEYAVAMSVRGKKDFSYGLIASA